MHPGRRFWRYQVDAGWAWVVCFASFFVQCVIFGTIQSFGTLFISLLNDFNSGESETAWVGSLGYGFLFVIGPVTTALCEHFGCRVMACAGSVLTTVSLLVTSFAPSISSMYFTFGVLWGTGGSFLFFSGLLILRFYFNRNLSFANGITMTGAGFGTLVFNVMLQELDSKYGWRGGMRVLSVFAALTFLCGCAYIPPPIDYLAFERPNLLNRLKRLIDPRPWRDRAFSMWVLSLSFILFAYFFPYTYLVKMALTLDVPVSQGALLLGYLSISAIFGKLLCGRLADLPRVRRLYIFVISATILSVSSMCVTAAKTYHGLLAYTIVAGFFDGCFVVTVPLITQDIVGKELMAKAVGSLYGVVAFPLTLGPPVLGELYKSTGSFTTAFFVSACFVLVGVSLIYIVQRIRPDLVHKEEPGREEVIPSPSIHSASVVDTLSGLCVTEPNLSVSHLDPVEIGSYQRFDSFRREDSRPSFVEPVQGRLASKTEIEAVYKQAVDNMSNTGVTNHLRSGSDVSTVTTTNVAAQSHSGSVFTGSVLSSKEITGDFDSPSGFQITPGETQASKTGDTLANENIVRLPDEEGIKIPGDGTVLQEGDRGTYQTDIRPDQHSMTSEVYSIAIAISNDSNRQHEALPVAQLDSDFSVPFTNVQPLEAELNNRGNRDPLIADATSDPELKETIVDGARPQEKKDAVEGTQDVNEILELVRLPPPPAIPRTGQLVALETEGDDDHDRAKIALTEREGPSVSHASLSEIKLDARDNDLSDKEVVDDPSSKELSAVQRKERLHLAVIDQLNLLSERLEAVAACQVQEEEDDLANGNAPDQRPVFSPALQSLSLTPLYSANHSVPLTPARAWSSFVNTPAPTPLQTPPSAFRTSAPTPIPTPRAPSQSVSGVLNVSSESQTSSAIHTQDSNDVFEISSPPSQQAASQRRSRCSSFSEVGQEFVLNEWSHLDLGDTQGSMEAFSSKPSSETDSSISNSARSLGDFHSVSEPIDVVGNTVNESHGGHMNSPENFFANQELEPSLPMCLPQQPYLQSPSTGNPFQQTYVNTNNQTELQRSHIHDEVEGPISQETVSAETVQEQHFHNETPECLAQKTTFRQFIITDDSDKSQNQPSPKELKPDQVFNGYIPESPNTQQPSAEEDVSHNDACPSSVSEPTQAYLPAEFTSELIDAPKQESQIASAPLESKLNPFLDSDKIDGPVKVCQQNPFHDNEICSSVGVPDEPQSHISSDPIVVPIQETPLDSIHLESQSNPFLKSDREESIQLSQEISQQNLFQQHEVCYFPDELISQKEESSYQPTNESIEQDHFKTDEIVTISSEERSLSSASTNLDSSNQTDELHCQHYYAKTLHADKQIVPQQIPFMEMDVDTRPEESKTELTEHAFIPLENTKEESDHTLETQSTWTMFSRSEEALIFEMDTESESSSDSNTKPDSDSASPSNKTKHRNQDPHACTTEQHSLFPSLQLFSDTVNNFVEVNTPGVPRKLPPPPRQVQRKRTDMPVGTGTGNARSQKVDVNKSESKQEGIVPEGKRIERNSGTSIQVEPEVRESSFVETHPVSSEGDLSATGNSVSEIELDLLSDSKPVERTQDPTFCKLSENSITDIVCEEFEFIEGKDDLLMNEELDDSNLDGDLAKPSIHEDIAPLLLQSAEPIQYLNLRDLPQDCQVLQKRPSTTSSTDDSSTSSTSTDSGLSENELPYSKLHEDSSDTSEHG